MGDEAVTDSLPWKLATWLIPLIIAIVFHEVSHGLVANALGDPTAKQRGRLTFNPIKHVDPFGTAASADDFGGQRSADIRLGQAGAGGRTPACATRGSIWSWSRLAGPGMNLLLAVVAAVIARAVVAMGPQGLFWAFLAQNLLNFLAINVFLAVFNLIPLAAVRRRPCRRRPAATAKRPSIMPSCGATASCADYVAAGHPRTFSAVPNIVERTGRPAGPWAGSGRSFLANSLQLTTGCIQVR